MDAREQARALFDAIADGQDIATFLHDDLSFRDDAGAVLSKDAVVERITARTKRGHGHRYVFGPAVAKRNVVFASWEWKAPGGEVVDSGTWFLSLDRGGQVTEWAEIAAGRA